MLIYYRNEEEKNLLTKFCIEKKLSISGATDNLAEALESHDNLIVKELFSLANSLEAVERVLRELVEAQRGLIVHDIAHIPNTMLLDVVSHIKGYRKRVQKEGIEEAKSFKKIGRPSIDYPTNWEEVYKKYKAREISNIKAIELLEIKRTSFFKLLKRYENQGE